MKTSAASTFRSDDSRWGKKLLLAALTMGTAAGPITLGLMQAHPLAGQILQSAGPLPSFEVASIRPDHSASSTGHIGYTGRGAPMDRFILTNMPVKELVCLAFAGKPCFALPYG